MEDPLEQIHGFFSDAIDDMSEAELRRFERASRWIMFKARVRWWFKKVFAGVAQR